MRSYDTLMRSHDERLGLEQVACNIPIIKI